MSEQVHTSSEYILSASLDSLAVERLPGEPARTVMWSWLAGFQGAKVRGTAHEVFVNSGDYKARVHGFAIRLESEVQIHGMVNGVALGTSIANCLRITFEARELDFQMRAIRQCMNMNQWFPLL